MPHPTRPRGRPPKPAPLPESPTDEQVATYQATYKAHLGIRTPASYEPHLRLIQLENRHDLLRIRATATATELAELEVEIAEVRRLLPPTPER